jgi:hypothetical protein
MSEFVKSIRKLDLKFFKEIREEIFSVLKNHEFKNGIYQLGVQISDNNDSNSEQFYKSIVKPNNKLIESNFESSFKYIHPTLKGGSIEKFINSFNDYKLVRTRIMYMKPNSCYSIHVDPTPRIHLPILTNKDCLIIFPENNIIKHMSADGNVYYTDTTNTHTFANFSQIPRIHLVSSIDEFKL